MNVNWGDITWLVQVFNARGQAPSHFQQHGTQVALLALMQLRVDELGVLLQRHLQLACSPANSLHVAHVQQPFQIQESLQFRP